MAGHSHAKNVARRKNAVDAKRGKVFSKLAKHIISAARNGPDPSMNLQLKYAVEAAKQANMPKDNIERAIKRGSGQLGGGTMDEAMYEGYGPGGTALLVEAVTDKKTRTGPEVRSIFDKRGGNFANQGAVAWMFKHRAVFTVKAEGTDEDSLMEIALEAGGDDLLTLDDAFEVSGPPDSFGELSKALDAAGVTTEEGLLTWVAENFVEIGDAETARKVQNLIDALEDNDDVTAVHCNWNVPPEILDQVLDG